MGESLAPDHKKTDQHRNNVVRWVFLFLATYVGTKTLDRTMNTPALSDGKWILAWSVVISTIYLASVLSYLWLFISVWRDGGRAFWREVNNCGVPCAWRALGGTPTIRRIYWLAVPTLGLAVTIVHIGFLTPYIYQKNTQAIQAIESFNAAHNMLDEQRYPIKWTPASYELVIRDDKYAEVMSNGTYVNPRICATIVTPSNPTEKGFDFGIQLVSVQDGTIVRVGVISDGRIYHDVYDAGEWRMADSSLSIMPVGNAGSLMRGISNEFCVIIDRDLSIFLVNDKVVGSFDFYGSLPSVPEGPYLLKVGVVFDHFPFYRINGDRLVVTDISTDVQTADDFYPARESATPPT